MQRNCQREVGVARPGTGPSEPGVLRLHQCKQSVPADRLVPGISISGGAEDCCMFWEATFRKSEMTQEQEQPDTSLTRKGRPYAQQEAL